MRLERLNNLPLNTVTPNFVAIFVFFGTASSFIERISFPEIEAKREAILFLFGCSEVNSTWIITSGLANQARQKHSSLVWYILNDFIDEEESKNKTAETDRDVSPLKTFLQR